jgi:hypothetical protein
MRYPYLKSLLSERSNAIPALAGIFGAISLNTLVVLSR